MNRRGILHYFYINNTNVHAVYFAFSGDVSEIVLTSVRTNAFFPSRKAHFQF